MTDEIKKIMKDISSSGLPLEIEISSFLVNNDWKVRNQVNYIDEDTGKERQIDIVAHKAVFEEFKNHDRLNFTMVIECKRDLKPWVFFTTAKEKDAFARLIVDSNNQKFFSYPALRKSPHHLGFNIHYSKMSGERAVIHYEPFKGTNGKKEKILDAKYQVTKGLQAQLEETKKYQTFALKRRIQQKPVVLYFPVICFEGSLYQLKFEDNDLKLIPVEYLQYPFRHAGTSFLIEVVTKKYFPDYLKTLDEYFEVVKTYLKG